MELGTLPWRRRVEERVARAGLVAASLTSIAVLGWLLWRTAAAGAGWVDVQFLTSFTSRFPEQAGIKAALLGSVWLGVLTLVLAVPVGVGAGIYLTEYARPGRVTGFLRTTIANLAGVPSVVFGLLGLAIFVNGHGIPLGPLRTVIAWGVYPFRLAKANLPDAAAPFVAPFLDLFIGLGRVAMGEPLGFVILAGALTLAAMSLPTIIVATEEALKAVPRTIREAAYGLGATRWQVVKHHVLPSALPGIATGSILALTRAVGETAPLILVGGAVAVFFVPDGPMSLYAALPLQTFFWAVDPRPEFRGGLAPAGTLVLLGLVLFLNLFAILLRNHYERKVRW